MYVIRTCSLWKNRCVTHSHFFKCFFSRVQSWSRWEKIHWPAHINLWASLLHYSQHHSSVSFLLFHLSYCLFSLEHSAGSEADDGSGERSRRVSEGLEELRRFNLQSKWQSTVRTTLSYIQMRHDDENHTSAIRPYDIIRVSGWIICENLEKEQE